MSVSPNKSSSQGVGPAEAGVPSSESTNESSVKAVPTSLPSTATGKAVPTSVLSPASGKAEPTEGPAKAPADPAAPLPPPSQPPAALLSPAALRGFFAAAAASALSAKLKVCSSSRTLHANNG